MVHEMSGAFDPATVVGLKLTLEEKGKVIKMKPCQPSRSFLQSRKKVIGERSRCCSQQLFHHNDCTQRKWISYSPCSDSLFCIRCLLFTDALSRDELVRPNQGNASTCAGFSSWEKLHASVKKHEMSVAHANAKIAEALFLQDRNIVCSVERKVQKDKLRRKRGVVSNRSVMKCVVDAIVLLAKQGLAF